jgi:hypothetical protein
MPHLFEPETEDTATLYFNPTRLTHPMRIDQRECPQCGRDEMHRRSAQLRYQPPALSNTVPQAPAPTHTPSQAKARVIIELQPDGTLVMETYTNGMRERTALQVGYEMHEMQEALSRKQREIDTSAERKRLTTILADLPAGSSIPDGYMQAHGDTAIADLVRYGDTGQGKMQKTPEFAEQETLRKLRRMWRNVAYGTKVSKGHGILFANKTVGDYGPKGKSNGKAKASPLPPGTIYATADLI